MLTIAKGPKFWSVYRGGTAYIGRIPADVAEKLIVEACHRHELLELAQISVGRQELHHDGDLDLETRTRQCLDSIDELAATPAAGD